MSIKSWFNSHGVHVTQTSQSLTGGLFSRTTKTPHTPYESHVRPDGVDREVLTHARRKKAVKDSEAAHIQYTHKKLKGNTADLRDVGGWQDVLANERESRFGHSSGQQVYSLDTQLAWVQAYLAPSFKETPDAKKAPRDERVLPGATMMVLLNAATTLARTQGLNAEEIANALACLQHIDMLGAIERPYDPVATAPNPVGGGGQPVQPRRTDGNNFDQHDLANAWHLAIALENSGEVGFSLLKHLTRFAPPVAGQNPTVGRQRDGLLHTYLQAAREKVAEATRVGEAIPATAMDNANRLRPDPRSIHAQINSRLNPVGTPLNQEPGGPPPGNYQQGVIGGRVLPNATLLDKALKAVSNHLQQVQAHAANGATAGRQITFDANLGEIRPGTNPNTYSVLNKDCNWWAANAVRNGIYSDDPGQSKQYRKLQARSEKMVTWLHRANQDTNGAGLSLWGRMGRQIRQTLVPMKNKSPFHAYNNIIPDSPHRLQSGTDAGGIADGQTIKQDLIWNLEKAIEQGDGTPLRSGVYPANIHGTTTPHPKAGQAAVPDDPPLAVLRQMARLAILQQQHRFNAKGDGANLFITRYNEGDPLQGLDIERAKEKMYEMLAGGKDAQSNFTKMGIDIVFRDENVQLSPERLTRWAIDVGGPAYLAPALGPWPDEEARKAHMRQLIANNRAAPGAAPPNWNQPDWDQFVAGVNRVLADGLDDLPHGITDLTNLTDTQAAQLVEAIAERHKLGHLIEMKDGGWVGAKTQGASYILSRLASFGTQGLGLDLRYLYGRHADIQFSTGTGGSDLFIGSVTGHRTQAGLGYVAGPGHVSKKGDGWSFGLAAGTNVTPLGGEWAKKIGALYRFRRVFSGVDSDDIRNAQLGRLARKLMDPTHDPAAGEGGAWVNPGDLGDQDILKQILQEFDDVSVGWLKSEDKAYKGAASASAVFGVKVGGWGPGIGAAIGAEYSRTKTEWSETGGSLKQEREIKASEFKVNVSGVLSLVAATLKELNLPADSSVHELLNPELWSGAFKAGFQDGAMATADVYRTGTSRRHTWIYHDGALTYTPGICSFYQKTHKNAASFAASILKKIDTLAADKAAVFETPRFQHLGQNPIDVQHAKGQADERNRMIDKEITKLLEDLHSALKAKPTQEFREYYEYSPKYLQMINDLESLIASEKSDPRWEKNKAVKARVKDYEAQLAKLKALDDETIAGHGQYRFNITDNVEFKQKNKGLNSFLVNWHEDLFRASRIDIYV